MKIFKTNLLLGLLAAVAVSGGLVQPTLAQPKMEAKMSVSGGFKQITHATKGRATLSGRTIKFSNFESSMGPKLRVYLVPGKVTSNASIQKLVKANKFADLGALKSIKGNQNYAIPTGSKLGKGATVIVWCDKFDVAFGSATLS